MDPILPIGITAALCTTLSFLPQVIKTHRSKHTRDLSIWTLFILALGITLWVVYGLYKKDVPIIAANSVTLMLVSYLLLMKIRHG